MDGVEGMSLLLDRLEKAAKKLDRKPRRSYLTDGYYDYDIDDACKLIEDAAKRIREMEQK
jgi:hypothetical protein